jgi:excinuclease ABC subunit A
VANVLVNYDLPWNPMVVEQRIGRVQRLALAHEYVVVWNLVAAATVEERVQLLNFKPWQYVTVLANRLSDIDTPAFREFLKEAVASFQQTVQRLRTKPEDVMPWKVHGERWHLGEKGFPAGKTVRWDRGLLPRLLALVREVEPNIEVDWEARKGIKLRVPGVSRAWAHWRTKEADALDCRFLGKKGQFNLSRIEKFGVSPAIHAERAGIDVLRLVFQHADHVHPAELKALLAEHLKGFRETFGKAPVQE